jgi:hypothetical protein
MSNFAVIRHYHFDKKDSDEIGNAVTEVFVPLLKGCNGFIKYYWIDNGFGEGISVGIFKTKEDGEASNSLAAEFSRNYLSGLVIQKPEITVGKILSHD